MCNSNLTPPKIRYDIYDLIKIVGELRELCPWDKEQTHESIRRNLLEESYEVMQAIDEKNSDELCEELGDLLLQIIFHSQISTEKNEFNFDDICDKISKKMIFRHPHVYGKVKVSGSEDVLKNWDELKSRESKNDDDGAILGTQRLKSVPKLLPALSKAQKIIKRTKNLGIEPKLYAFACCKNDNNLNANLFLNVCESVDQKIDVEDSFEKFLSDFILFFEGFEKNLIKTGVSLTNMSNSSENASKINEMWEDCIKEKI